MSQQTTASTHMSVQDASNYFKGLLILIGKDRKVLEPECVLIKRIGKALGFEKEFCNSAVQDLLENTYIIDTLPEFSSQEIAKKFILDGLTLAASDGEIHIMEEEWLQSTAENYYLDDNWFQEEKLRAIARIVPPKQLEAETLTVEYSTKG